MDLSDVPLYETVDTGIPTPYGHCLAKVVDGEIGPGKLTTIQSNYFPFISLSVAPLHSLIQTSQQPMSAFSTQYTKALLPFKQAFT